MTTDVHVLPCMLSSAKIISDTDQIFYPSLQITDRQYMSIVPYAPMQREEFQYFIHNMPQMKSSVFLDVDRKIPELNTTKD